MGKQHRSPFTTRTQKSEELLQLVHSDVCGPLEERSFGGSRYFITFIDDKSRFTHVYFLANKSEVTQTFKVYCQMVENQTNKIVKILRPDNGGEYMSNDLSAYLKSKGIVRQITIPYTLEQNGMAERMNRTLLEYAKSMMSNAGLEKKFWAEAVNTAAHLRNRIISSSHEGHTPYKMWFVSKHDVSHLRVFGCKAFVHIPEEKRRKLDSKSRI